MSKLYCKLGVHALREHELYTLRNIIIEFWEQRVSVTAVPAFTESDHILSDAICSCCCWPIHRDGTLVE